MTIPDLMTYWRQADSSGHAPLRTFTIRLRGWTYKLKVRQIHPCEAANSEVETCSGNGIEAILTHINRYVATYPATAFQLDCIIS
jgi:hypothetical protein